LQDFGAKHVTPQPPQFAESTCVSTQAAPHTVSAPAQMHVPDMHGAVSGHTVPQPPQFC